MRFKSVLLSIGVLALSSVAFAQPAPSPMSDDQKTEMTHRVRQEFLHAWDGYRQYAWGHDDLMPLSKKPHDWLHIRC
ncbi:glycoside hydrolase family 47 protein [Acidobacterium sp. S8]|uniref:glycoside hydrolase family 47 protein n=1 Tax=Acidobacterium sp. S8 TaxID=1641854 RepID=UPI001C20304B|nr:glycoside hydrolase family 47 protein [Acidobacterium sp. S8]